MKKFTVLLFILFATISGIRAQQILPGISVQNLNGKIVVSWRNEYIKPIANLSIQRSYDSLKNFTTISSVLNPQNIENGYADANAPYDRMYYRVFIAFEGGSYIISTPARPTKDTAALTRHQVRYPWQADPNEDPRLQVPPVLPPAIVEKDKGIPFPSSWIFTAKDNNVIIHLPDAGKKKYTAKFFDEADHELFELTNLPDEYLIIEKVNFIRSGWYHFELYSNGVLVEKNRFQIQKDGKITNEPIKRGNR